MAMKNFYSEDSDGIVITFNDIRDVDGIDIVPFYIEQERGDGKEPFNYAEGTLPYFRFSKSFGFSDEKLDELLDFVKRNSMLIYEIARDKATQE